MMKTETQPVPNTPETRDARQAPEARDARDTRKTRQPNRIVVDYPTRHPNRNRRRAHPDLPRRRTFEPLPLFSLGSWSATDFLTLGLGALLIVGLLVAVAQGIHWVILPGAAAVMFAIITTQLRWGRMSRAKRLAWHRVRRATETRVGGDDPDGRSGGIVQLPEWREPPRRAG